MSAVSVLREGELMKTSIQPSCSQPGGQRGAATLVVTSLLFLVLAMTLAFTHRQLIFEQRSGQNQVRAAIAQEAAQAGLEWAQALINSPALIDGACQASAATGVTGGLQTWRDLHRHYEPATQLQRSRPALSAACLRDGDVWRCHCPGRGAARLSLPSGDAPVPGFVVQLEDHDVPGQIRLRAKGCSQAGPDCWDMEKPTPAGQAQRHLQTQLALVGGLRTKPAAALTALGSVHATALGAHHSASGASGVAIHAGGGIHLSSPSISTVAGGTLSAGLLPHDTELVSTSPEQLFSALWGMGMERWATQSSVYTFACVADCASALQTKISGRSNRMVYVPGDVTLEASAGSPVLLGSADEPVLLIVRGKLKLIGAVQVHGALYANEIHWNAAGAGALLRGAAWSQTDVYSDGSPQVYFDDAVLERLRWNAGSFAVLQGSWKEGAP